MKLAPVHRALAANAGVQSRILHTGQHYDHLMSDVFFAQLDLPMPDISLNVGSGSHAEQTARVMLRFEKHVARERPDLVVVYGDVNSTLAAALVCAKLGIPCAHVEAGLRSGDRTMPEEVNRIVTDALANILFVTEPSGRRNLEREGADREGIFETGNVMIDSLADLLAREGKVARARKPGRKLILVTLHRPVNVDDPVRLGEIATFLQAMAGDHDVLFPVHPRTKARLEATGTVRRLGSAVRLAEPLPYRDFVLQMLDAALIVTDSGGIQEESAYLGVPCLTLRAATERPVTVEAGTNLLESACDGDLPRAARDLMGRIYPAIGDNPVLRAALWDGRAGERIARILAEKVQ